MSMVQVTDSGVSEGEYDDTPVGTGTGSGSPAMGTSTSDKDSDDYIIDDDIIDDTATSSSSWVDMDWSEWSSSDDFQMTWMPDMDTLSGTGSLSSVLGEAPPVFEEVLELGAPPNRETAGGPTLEHRAAIGCEGGPGVNQIDGTRNRQSRRSVKRERIDVQPARAASVEPSSVDESTSAQLGAMKGLANPTPFEEAVISARVNQLEMEQILTLFYEADKRPCLPARPLQLPSVVPSDQLLFAESTAAMRRNTAGARLRGRADEWRNSGGKNAVKIFEVPEDLIFDGKPADLCLALRKGKVKRPGHADMTYHQYNIGEGPRPGARSGKVTLYHIVPQTSTKSKPQFGKALGKDKLDRPVLDMNYLPKPQRRRVSQELGNQKILQNVVLSQDSLEIMQTQRVAITPKVQAACVVSGVLAVIACVALVLSAGSGDPDGASDLHASASDGCFGTLLPNAKRWPARCSNRSQVGETCPSTQFGTLVERSGCRLWCEAGFEPVGILCCGPDGQYGNRDAAGCLRCPTGHWSDGARPCQACTACEQRRGSITVQNCSQTEDTKCHSYWKEMENSYPEVNQNADGVSSAWHLPRDFVTWSDGTSLFAFGGAASSLPEDTTTTTMCLPPAAANPMSGHRRVLQKERNRLFPASRAKGEPQLTNELWQLQLSKETSPVTMEFEARSVDSIVFEPMCNTHRADIAETATACNAAGKGCVWSDADHTCSHDGRASIAIIQTINPNAAYPSHPTATEMTAAAHLRRDTSRRVSVGWALQAVNGAPTANLTYDGQMTRVKVAASRAKAGRKLTLSFTDDPFSLQSGSKGSWQLIGGGRSRAVDEYFHNKLKYGYFGSNYGRGVIGSNTSRGTDEPVREEDFDAGIVGRLQLGVRSPGVWPRARFGASAWGATAPSRRTTASMATSRFSGVMFSGMMSRPCFNSETMSEQRVSGSGQETFLMPNDLWGFSADTKQFTYLGGDQNWIWRENLEEVLADFSAGMVLRRGSPRIDGLYSAGLPFGRWGAQTFTLQNEFYMFSGQTMVVNMRIDRDYTDAERSQRFLLNDLWKLSRVSHPDDSLDDTEQWAWSLQRPCMQAIQGGAKLNVDANTAGSKDLQFPGPRTGAATWTPPCCMVGASPKPNHVNSKMCNAAKFKNQGGQCAHGVSNAVFMFGGVGLMESHVRTNEDYCLVDQPGHYITLNAREGTTSWVQNNSSKSWVAELDWALYHSLCDLWQADQANHWSLLGACASGLRSPVNSGVPHSLEVNAVNPVPFPDALALAGLYKASTWADDAGNLWLFGGFTGSGFDFETRSEAHGLLKEISREYSPGATVCNHDLWAYDPVQGGSWLHVLPGKPRPSKTDYLTADAGTVLSDFTWPQLGKCGATAWVPWHRPLYRDSGDPLTVGAHHANILGGTQHPEMPVADIDGDDFRETECKSYERAALYQMTKFELQDMLNASGMDTTGNHDALAQRLLHSYLVDPMRTEAGKGKETLAFPTAPNARQMGQQRIGALAKAFVAGPSASRDWDSKACVARPLQFCFKEAT